MAAAVENAAPVPAMAPARPVTPAAQQFVTALEETFTNLNAHVQRIAYATGPNSMVGLPTRRSTGA